MKSIRGFEFSAQNCPTCRGSGFNDTGNNVLPCRRCPAGLTALFTNTFVMNGDGVGTVTGAEVVRHFLNDSPDPILNGIQERDLPGRKGLVFAKCT